MSFYLITFLEMQEFNFFRKKKNIDLGDKLVYNVKAPDRLQIPAMFIFKPDFLK